MVHVEDLRSVPFPEWHTEVLFSTAGFDSIPLGYFVDARFAPDSSLIVTAVSKLMVFAPNGRLLRTIGRDGDGPGEYRNAFRLDLAVDGTSLVGDYDSRRVTLLSPAGQVRRVLPFLGTVSASYEIDPITLLADGRMLATFWQHRPNRDEPGIHVGSFDRDSAPLLVFDSNGRSVGSLGTWAGLERLRGDGDRLVPRFGRTVLYHGSGERTVIGPSDSLDLSVFTGTELTLRLISPNSAIEPTDRAIREWEQAIARDYPDVATTYLDAINAGPKVPALPAIGGARVDSRGNVWIGAFAPPGDSTRLWRIFSIAGKPVGKVELPATSDPMIPGGTELLDIRDDRIALLRRLQSGEEFLEIRQIRRR